MNDSMKRVDRLANAALETAIRYNNEAVGPDHLLYVICSTEEGRREIERRGGRYAEMISHLSISFRSRSQMGLDDTPGFSEEFQRMISEVVAKLREEIITSIEVRDMLELFLAGNCGSVHANEAMRRGGLVIDSVESDGEDDDFDAVVEAGSRMQRGLSAEPGRENHDNDVGPGPGSPQEAVTQETSQDPHYQAVLNALRDLTVAAEREELDPVIGRDEEIDAVINILQRRRKGNVLLVGEPGVGKTAVAEGVAQVLAMSDTPVSLASRPILEIALSDLVAGTRYRGDFELRLRHLMTIARKRGAVLFIDEAHALVGTGTSGNGMDAANILKPAMARGELQIIAATTPAEMRGLRKDKALMRRLEVLQLREPDKETAVEILRGMVEVYSNHHGIEYDEGVVEHCVELSMRHMPERRLPDKALDILDTAAVEAKYVGASMVTREFIPAAITSMTGVNAGLPRPEDMDVVRGFPNRMKARIFGQDEAIETLERAVRLSMTGVTRLGVAGAYLFNGPTGVGKTETAREMARALDIPLVRVDMSEFMEPHSVSRLIGAPPGYVGYDDEGVLIAAAETNPRMVLLLDEVEKAHPKVYDILLQVLDDGRLTSADGRLVSFRGAHVVMTANIGASAAEKAPLGFGRSVDQDEVAQKAISETFRKELLARIRYKIQFKAIGGEAARDIVASQVKDLVDLMMARGMELEVRPEVIEGITAGLPSSGVTGRVVSDAIDQNMADVIAEFMASNADVTSLVISWKDGKTKIASAFR